MSKPRERTTEGAQAHRNADAPKSISISGEASAAPQQEGYHPSSHAQAAAEAATVTKATTQ